MKQKRIKEGRPTLIHSIENFFKRAWTLEEASIYLVGSKTMLPENQKLIDLLRQSKKPAELANENN